MTTQPNKIILAKIRLKELNNKIRENFPDVEVEQADMEEMMGSKGRELQLELQGRGFPPPSVDVHGYLLICGDPIVTEAAATLADNEAARISEEDGVEIRVERRKVAWCKKSQPPVASVSTPGGNFKGPVWEIVGVDQKGNVLFMCCIEEEHDHDFGNLTRVYQAS